MTPIDVTVPYDSMKNMELPPNLHIQSEPIRFHPGNDLRTILIFYFASLLVVFTKLDLFIISV